MLPVKAHHLFAIIMVLLAAIPIMQPANDRIHADAVVTPAPNASTSNYLPVIRGVVHGPAFTPSPLPTATDMPEPGTLAAPTLYDISNPDGDGEFTVAWSTSPGAEFYRLEQQYDSGDWQQIYKGPSLTQSRNGLAVGQYCYRVRALNSSTDSEWSDTKCAEVLPSSTPTPTPTATATPGPLTCEFQTIGQFLTPGLAGHRMTYLHIPDLIVITGGVFTALGNYCGPSIDCYCQDDGYCHGESSQIYVYDVIARKLFTAGQLDISTRDKIALPLGDDKILLTGSDTSDDIVIQIERVPGGFESSYVTRAPMLSNVVNAITIDLETALVVSEVEPESYRAFVFGMLDGSKKHIGYFGGIGLYRGEHHRPLRMDLKQSKFLFSGVQGWVIIDTETGVISNFLFPELDECQPNWGDQGLPCPRPLGMEVIPLNADEILVTNGQAEVAPTAGVYEFSDEAFLFDTSGQIIEKYKTVYASGLRLRLQMNNGDAVLINGISSAWREYITIESGAEIFDSRMSRFTQVNGPVNPHAWGNALRLEYGSFLISGGYGDEYIYDNWYPITLTTGGAENIELVTCE